MKREQRDENEVMQAKVNALPHPPQIEVNINEKFGWKWCLICSAYVSQLYHGHNAEQVLNRLVAAGLESNPHVRL